MLYLDQAPAFKFLDMIDDGTSPPAHGVTETLIG
jgi:hypothetical protein